jgi:ketosteroid isomerase-like protein
VSEGPSDPRIELVRAGQVALERGDRDAFRELVDRMMHPDGEWEPLLTGVEGGPYVGPQGVLTWFDDFMSALEVRYETPEFVLVGDNVVLTLGAMHLRGRESDAEVTRDVGTVYDFDGDKVRRGRVYESRADAIAAAEALAAGTESTDVRSVQ